MNPHQDYKKAPVTEALIDLRVESSRDIDLSKLKGVHDAIALNYPNCVSIGLAQGEIQFSPGGATASASNTPIGYRLSTADQKQILQVRLDGFTFSRLEPYESWEALCNEARQLWEIYIEVAHPKKIQQISVRYINRLNLPFDQNGSLDFRDYLRTVPEVSPDIPQGLINYLMQLQIPQDDLDALLIISQAMLPRDQESALPVLLDISLLSSVNLPVDYAFWELLEKFRIRKNEVFEACITDQTRELIR